MAKCKKKRPIFNVKKALIPNSFGKRISENMIATKVVTVSSVKMLATKKNACVKTILKRVFGVAIKYAIEPLSV